MMQAVRTSPKHNNIDDLNYNAWLNLINEEKSTSNTNVKRVVSCFFRASDALPYSEKMWLERSKYLMNELSLFKEALVVLNLAVRFCPSSGELWLMLMKCQEGCNCDAVDFITTRTIGVMALEKAKKNENNSEKFDSQIYELYLECANTFRRLNTTKKSEDIFNQMKTRFAELVNYCEQNLESFEMQALMHAMRVESNVVKSLESTRLFGEKLVKKFGDQSEAHLEYLKCLRSFDAPHTSKAFQNACMQAVDDIDNKISEMYLQWANEQGSPNDVEDAKLFLSKEKSAGTKRNLSPRSGQASPIAKRLKQQEIQSPRSGVGSSNNVSFPKIDSPRGRSSSPRAKLPISPRNQNQMMDVEMDGNKTPKGGGSPNPKRNENGNTTPKGGGSPRSPQRHMSFREKLKHAKKRKNTPSPARVLPYAGKHFHQKDLEDGQALDPTKVEEKCTLYVGKLDWSVTEQQLVDLFQTVDGLKDTRLVMDFRGNSKGFAYLDYETKAQVEKAVKKFNNYKLNGREILVAASKPTKALYDEKIIFVKPVPDQVDEVILKSFFKDCGEVVNIRFPNDKNNRRKRANYCYVEFVDDGCVVKALEYSNKKQLLYKVNDEEIKDHTLIITRSIPMKNHELQRAGARGDMPQHIDQKAYIARLEEKERKANQVVKNTIIVKNMDFSVSEDELRGFFEGIGPVQKVSITLNKRGQSRGFGFVEFVEDEHANDALMMNNHDFKGSSISVSMSTREITVKKTAEERGDSKGREKGFGGKKGGKKGGKFGGKKGKGKGKGKGKNSDFDKGKGGKRGRLDLNMNNQNEGGDSNNNNEDDGGGEPKMKTNEDFRKMLFG